MLTQPSPGVILCSTAPPDVCGIGDYTARLVTSMRARGVAVDVWTRASVARGRSWDRMSLDALATRLTQQRPAVLHVQFETALYDHNPTFGLQVAWAARRAGIRLVTTFHSLDGPPSLGKAHRLALFPLLLASESVVVCSERQRQALARLPSIGPKVRLVPVGSNIPIATGHPSSAGPVRLVYFGFVWRGKGIETAVRTLAAVRKSTQATLTVAGAVKDERYREEVHTLAAELGVADWLTFTDELSAGDVAQQLAMSDIALLPYPTGASTGHGTLAAALEHRLPVVTTAAPAHLSPLFTDGKNLLLAPTDDEEAFVRQAVRLATDSELRTRLAEGAAHLSQHFSWSNIAAHILDLKPYRDVFPKAERAWSTTG